MHLRARPLRHPGIGIGARPGAQLGTRLGTPLGAHPGMRFSARLGAGVLAAVLAVCTTAGSAIAIGSTTAPAAAAPGAVASQARLAEAPKSELLPQLTLAPVRPVLLSNDESAEFELWIENTGDTELGSGRVTLSLDPERVSGEAGLDAPFADETALALVDVETPVVPAGEGRLVPLSIPRADWPLTAASDAGVYRVASNVTFSSDEAAGAEAAQKSLSTTAPIVWRGAGGLTQVQLTTVVPMLLPESIPSLPRRGQLDELMGPGSGLDALLTTAEARGATLAIDPRVVAGVRVYGDSASAASQSFVERLATTSAPSFPLQFADADPSVQAALGFSRLLAPEGLSFATRYGTFPQPDPAESISPTAQPNGDAASGDTVPDESAGSGDAGEPGVPGITELTSWPTGLPGTAWPAAGTVNGEVLDLLQRNGYSRVLASEGNVSISGGGARGSANGVEYLVSDAALDTAALAALAAETDTEHRAGVALTSALLVFRAQDGVPGTVLTFDRRETPESSYASDLLNTLSALPWVDPVAPDALPEGAVTLNLAADAATVERTAALRDAVAREPQVRDYSRVLVDPANLIDLQRVRLLLLFSARNTAPGSNFDAVAARAVDRDDETLHGVRVVTSTHTQLVGTTSRVPIQVRNTLPFDALITAAVVPTNAALIVTDPPDDPTLVPGESSANILLPVRARVSSGESGLAVELSAASGGDVFTSGTLEISIRSSWETVALGSLGLLTAAFFGFGIWRSIRRRSRASAGDPGIVEP